MINRAPRSSALGSGVKFNLSCNGVVEHLECHLEDTMAGTSEGHGPVSALQSRLRGRLMGLVQNTSCLRVRLLRLVQKQELL